MNTISRKIKSGSFGKFLEDLGRGDYISKCPQGGKCRNSNCDKMRRQTEAMRERRDGRMWEGRGERVVS